MASLRVGQNVLPARLSRCTSSHNMSSAAGQDWKPQSDQRSEWVASRGARCEVERLTCRLYYDSKQAAEHIKRSGDLFVGGATEGVIERLARRPKT